LTVFSEKSYQQVNIAFMTFLQDYLSAKESCEFDVQNVRALPAPAGSILAWGTSFQRKNVWRFDALFRGTWVGGRTLHFGGRASTWATVPRIALSMAFSTAEFEDPWLRLAALKSELPGSENANKEEEPRSVGFIRV